MIKIIYEVEDGCVWKTYGPYTKYFKNEDEIQEFIKENDAFMDHVRILKKEEE